jgi:hypothetical protein
MRADEISKHLRRQPFRPIRVYVSDGSAYDVRHPELMFVSRSEVVIGLDPGTDVIPERSVYCDPVHITRIEPINGESVPAMRPGT